MNALAWVLFAGTIAVGVIDWISVMRSVRWLEYATKVGFMLGLMAVAITLQPVSVTERGFFVVALALGLISDVFLMLPRDMFTAGLVAALLEHLAYITAFRARTLHTAMLVAGLIIALVSVAVFFPPIERSIRRDHPRLLTPVIAYVAVFTVMVASAGGTGSGVALIGALLFFYSDAVLAWNRFVRSLRWGRVVNIVPYHLGQAILVLSLVS